MGREIAQSSLKARVRNALPRSVMNLRRVTVAVLALTRADAHECNLCGFTGNFLPFGDPPRRGAACAKCDSKERHRLMGLWLYSNRDVVADAKILHFAPEPVLAQIFRQCSANYRSADLDPTYADTVLNVESIDLPDHSVDIVVCSHVLEHVDDKKALREIHRILSPSGSALLMFPIVEGWDRTYEDPVHTDIADRVKYYGQADHVRMFGRDVRDRIASAGFRLTEFTAEEPNVARYGLSRGEKLFIATKLLG